MGTSEMFAHQLMAMIIESIVLRVCIVLLETPFITPRKSVNHEKREAVTPARGQDSSTSDRPLAS